ncbi:hypothetical protein [Halomonas sp. M20]|uniref:hypothetical protein n=1 Tax=Halomonas sp. M20 TaxID=2763264 RepID=UPI001D0B4C16|nr:hypothetical protein [Halomonas sp. M20]
MKESFPDKARHESDEQKLEPWYARRKRSLLAVAAFGVLAGLAFFYLHSGHIEGGAFVSLLTLAFGVGLVTLIWPRITHITILGSEIKLQRLTKEAETLVAELDSGKIDLYRTALGLMKHSAQPQEDESGALGERSASLVELLGNIEKARLLEVLDEEALSTTDRVIDELVCNVSDQAHLPTDRHSASLISRAQAVIQQFDEGEAVNERQGILGVDGSDSSSELFKAVEDLKMLLRYRQRIQELRTKHGLEATKNRHLA